MATGAASIHTSVSPPQKYHQHDRFYLNSTQNSNHPFPFPTILTPYTLWSIIINTVKSGKHESQPRKTLRDTHQEVATHEPLPGRSSHHRIRVLPEQPSRTLQCPGRLHALLPLGAKLLQPRALTRVRLPQQFLVLLARAGRRKLTFAYR